MGGSTAVKKAIADADLKPEDIQYYNAHGTSTEINDPTETKMLKIAFGDYAYKLKVSSTKSMHGHCVAGGGGLEAIACILAIREGFYPPTSTWTIPIPNVILIMCRIKFNTAKLTPPLRFAGLRRAQRRNCFQKIQRLVKAE